MFKMLLLAKNMFGPRRKSMPGVEIGPWPTCGHIVMHMIFSKILKIHGKWRIFIGFQIGFKSHGESLAKWPNEMKTQSFWPKWIMLAKNWHQTIRKSFLAMIWPLFWNWLKNSFKDHNNLFNCEEIITIWIFLFLKMPYKIVEGVSSQNRFLAKGQNNV